MPAGRPHETVGNGGPRWMTAASRQREDTEPGLQAGSPPFKPLTCAFAVSLPAGSVQFRWIFREHRVNDPATEIFGVGEQVPVGARRLGDRGMAGPSLGYLRVEIGRYALCSVGLLPAREPALRVLVGAPVGMPDEGGFPVPPAFLTLRYGLRPDGGSIGCARGGRPVSGRPGDGGKRGPFYIVISGAQFDNQYCAVLCALADARA
jgi:hypothetical protein